VAIIDRRRHDQPDDGVEVIKLTSEEYQRAVQNTLDRLGLSYEELEEQARRDDFVSLRARKVWLLVASGQHVR
jgi:hypothetical protein